VYEKAVKPEGIVRFPYNYTTHICWTWVLYQDLRCKHEAYYE